MKTAASPSPRSAGATPPPICAPPPTACARRSSTSCSHWYYRGDRLIAVDAINDSRAYMVGKRLIEMGKSPSPAVVTDPATDLKPLLRA